MSMDSFAGTYTNLTYAITLQLKVLKPAPPILAICGGLQGLTYPALDNVPLGRESSLRPDTRYVEKFTDSHFSSTIAELVQILDG